jgi:hypothetical protein
VRYDGADASPGRWLPDARAGRGLSAGGVPVLAAAQNRVLIICIEASATNDSVSDDPCRHRGNRDGYLGD